MLLEEKGISDEDYAKMDAEAKSELFNELSKINAEAFEKIQKDLEDSEEKANKITAAIKTMEENQAEGLKVVFEAMKQQGLAIAKLLKNGAGAEEGDTVKGQLVEHKETIMNIAKRVSGEDVEIKADTVVGSIALNTWGHNLADVGQLGTRKLNMIDLFPTITISSDNLNKKIHYWDWDEATTVRASDMVAEGAAFPQSTAKWKQFSIDIRKVGDTLPVSEEFFEDESMFSSELELFLATNVAIKVDDQMLNGDGLGENLNGLNDGAVAFVPVASGIVDANIYDLTVKVSEDITTARGNKYRPNFQVMNITDINKMKLKKDANNNYLVPPFVSQNGNEVAGVLVIENNAQAVNTMVQGDSRYARIYKAAGFTLSKGTIGNQFTEDMMTLKVRQRLAFLMREVDKTGFRKVASISAALTTLQLP